MRLNQMKQAAQAAFFLCSPLWWHPPPALSDQVPPKLLSVEAQHPAAMPNLHMASHFSLDTRHAVQ